MIPLFRHKGDPYPPTSKPTAEICGTCRIPVGAYPAGSLLGFIPLTIVFAVLGSGGIKRNFYPIAIGIGLLLLAVGGGKRLAPAFRSPEARNTTTQPEMMP